MLSSPTFSPYLMSKLAIPLLGHSLYLYFQCIPYYFLTYCKISGLIFRSLIHFELIFSQGERQRSNFSLLHVNIQFSQQHLLKRLSFLHCVFWVPLSKSVGYSCIGLCLGLLFWSICLPVCFCRKKYKWSVNTWEVFNFPLCKRDANKTILRFHLTLVRKANTNHKWQYQQQMVVRMQQNRNP
jgi:hypothetical protein